MIGGGNVLLRLLLELPLALLLVLLLVLQVLLALLLVPCLLVQVPLLLRRSHLPVLQTRLWCRRLHLFKPRSLRAARGGGGACSTPCSNGKHPCSAS